jgi:nicotinamidase-related amidase
MKAALLLIDFVNPLDFGGDHAFTLRALAAARMAAVLKTRARARGIPIVYANDNFGQWTSEFSSLVASIRATGGPARALVDSIAPEHGDYSILKPRHSAFFGTPLEFLLDEIKVRQLVLAGLATDICITFTANDAYLRKFELWIPSDCSAAETPRRHRQALEALRRTTKARTDAAGPARQRKRPGR